MPRTYYFLQTCFKKDCFSAPRRTSKAMVSDTVPWGRKLALTFGLGRGRSRICSTSFRRATELGSYWLFQKRAFSFSLPLAWLLACGIISVSSFWGVTSSFVSWLCGTERGCWNLKMCHKVNWIITFWLSLVNFHETWNSMLISLFIYMMKYANKKYLFFFFVFQFNPL